MAEKVEITGSLGNGYIENAASEATLVRIFEVLNKQASGQTNSAKLQELLNNANRDGIQATESLTNQLLNSSSGLSSFTKGLPGILAGMASKINAGVELAFSDTTPKVADFTSAVGNAIPVVGGLVTTFGNIIQGNIDNFRQLATVGIDFGSNLGQLRDEVTEAGVDLGSYKKALIGNIEALSLFGGSATAGADKFKQVLGTVTKAYGSRLDKLGLTMEDQAEYSAAYLKRSTSLGKAQGKSQEDLAKGTYEYMMQLDELSRITGMTRDQAKAALDEQTKDLRLKSLLMSVDEQTRRNIEGVTASIQDADIKNAITEMIATGGVPLSNTAQQLALFNPELARAAAGLKNGSVSSDQFSASLRQVAKDSEARSQRMGNVQSAQIAAGVKSYDATIKLAGTFNNFGEGLTEAQKAQKAAQDEASKTIMSFERAITNIKNLFVSALGPGIETASNAISGLVGSVDPDSPIAQGIARFAGIINSFIYDITKGGGFGEAFRNLWEDIKPAVTDAATGLIDFLGPLLGDLISKAFKSLMPSWLGGDSDADKEKAKKESEARRTEIATQREAMLKGKSEKTEQYKTAVDRLKDTSNQQVKELEIIKEKTGVVRSAVDKSQAALPTPALPNNSKKTTLQAEPLASSQMPTNKGNAVPESRPSTTPQKLGNEASNTKVELMQQEITALTGSINSVNYDTLSVPKDVLTTLDIGTEKTKALRLEVSNLSREFAKLNNTGTDKITKGIEQLSSSFKDFNSSFVEQFLPKFASVGESSQEELLSAISDKLEAMVQKLNVLVSIQDSARSDIRRTATYTRSASGNLF